MRHVLPALGSTELWPSSFGRDVGRVGAAITVAYASPPRASKARFAALAELAAIFIPSSAMVPSLPIPSRAHSTSTCATNTSGKASNRLTDTCSGTFLRR